MLTARVLSEVLDRAVTPQRIALAAALVDHHFLFYGAPIADHILLPLLAR